MTNEEFKIVLNIIIQLIEKSASTDDAAEALEKALEYKKTTTAQSHK